MTLLLSVGLYAQEEGIQWEHGTLQQALDKAKANKKGPNVVFLDCYTSWCGPCKYMATKVFTTKEAGKYFNKNFVCIKIDMEKGEGVQLMEKYGVAAFPTFLILNPDGTEIGRVVGGGELEDFIKRVEAAMDPAKSPSVILEKYRGSKDINDAIAYLEALKENYMTAKMDEFFGEFWNDLGYSVYSDELWPYIQEAAGAKSSIVYDKFISDYPGTVRMYGDKIKELLKNTTYNKLRSYLAGKTEFSADEVAALVERLKYMAPEDRMSVLICNTATAYAAGDLEKVGMLLNADKIYYDFTYMERVNIERMFTMIKGIPETALAKYYRDMNDYTSKASEDLKKVVEQYKDVVVPEEEGAKNGAIRAIRMM